MPVFQHIRYARSVRFGEPEQAAQDEDCHFLSIYTPSREGRRPVLVWIHGGAYIAGRSAGSGWISSDSTAWQ